MTRAEWMLELQQMRLELDLEQMTELLFIIMVPQVEMLLIPVYRVIEFMFLLRMVL